MTGARRRLRDFCGGAVLALAMVAGAGAAKAGVLYSDGAINGTYDAWTINFGYQVEDSFTLSGGSTLTGVTFGNWLFPGDTASSVQWAIVGSEGSQTPVCGSCSGVGSLTALSSYINGYGYNVVDQSFSLPSLHLGGGTYWLELQNLAVSNGDPGYWDMNGGPSSVWESYWGDVTGGGCTNATGQPPGTCSNSFTILGNSSKVPEPATLSILGAALFGFGAVRRRKAKARS